MTKEDVEFLKKLQQEMLTQDNAQAAPRFWVVKDVERIYNVTSDIDGYEVILDSERAGESKEEVLSFLKDWTDIEPNEFNKYEKCNSLYELIECLRKEGFDAYEVSYRDIYEIIAENTLFLTLAECEKHIELNRHHYIRPHPYCMTAWRSPQVERLFKILENENWDKFIIEGDVK